MVFAKSGCYRLGRTWRKENTNLDRSPESTMRPATYYYVAQVSPHPSHRQIQQDAAPQTTGRDRHARVPRRAHLLLAEGDRSAEGWGAAVHQVIASHLGPSGRVLWHLRRAGRGLVLPRRG